MSAIYSGKYNTEYRPHGTKPPWGAHDTLVLLSGGLDSAVLLWKERERAGLALTWDYGQPNEREERVAAGRLAQAAGVSWSLDTVKVAGMDAMFAGSGEPGARVVPARNLVLLAHAVNMGASMGLRRIVFGATRGDYEGYADCRPEFVAEMDTLARRFGCVVEAPLSDLHKREVVRLGALLKCPMDLSWSCYRPKPVTREACGACNACVERDRALAEANDPS